MNSYKKYFSYAITLTTTRNKKKISYFICNKIVISSDCISGPKEFLLDGKGGYLFKNNNLNSFVKTINDFLQDNNHNILLKKINAKKNLELLICKGFKGVPNLSVPRVLASIVVAAISKEANTI